MSLVGAHPEGELSPEQLASVPRVALVLGNEREGIRDEIARACTARVRVPMRGFVESLNMSVTAAVLLYAATLDRPGDLDEASRRRLYARGLYLTVPQAEDILGLDALTRSDCDRGRARLTFAYRPHDGRGSLRHRSGCRKTPTPTPSRRRTASSPVSCTRTRTRATRRRKSASSTSITPTTSWATRRSASSTTSSARTACARASTPSRRAPTAPGRRSRGRPAAGRGTVARPSTSRTSSEWSRRRGRHRRLRRPVRRPHRPLARASWTGQGARPGERDHHRLRLVAAWRDARASPQRPCGHAGHGAYPRGRRRGEPGAHRGPGRALEHRRSSRRSRAHHPRHAPPALPARG